MNVNSCQVQMMRRMSTNGSDSQADNCIVISQPEGQGPRGEARMRLYPNHSIGSRRLFLLSYDWAGPNSIVGMNAYGLEAICTIIINNVPGNWNKRETNVTW
jgi:hypothetical protein